MRRRQLLLAAIVVSPALGFTGSLPNFPDTWGFAIGSAGLLLGLVAAVGQHRMSGAYVRPFTSADWTPVGEELHLRISDREHGRGSAPTVTLLLRQSDGSLEEVMTDVHHGPHPGDVTIKLARTVGGPEGEIRIV